MSSLRSDAASLPRRRRPARALRRSMAWMAGGIGVVVCAIIFLLWGRNGPSYILDLIAAFCG
jgi:hypothetical protein